jgi:hypothetical protein
MGVGQLALAVAAAWFGVHAAIYAVEMCRLDGVLYRHVEHVLKHFFGWQAAGFLVAAIVVSRRRPSAVGRVLGGYLALSTAALLAFAQDAAMFAPLAVLLLWTTCAVYGMRLAIARAAGQRYATWGVAAAAVYAALVPICFFLGVLHAITPPIVAALAVIAAAPGAVAWLRRLASRGAVGGDSCRRWRQGDTKDRRPESPPTTDAERGNPNSIVAWCLLEVIWAILAVEFIGASTPEVAFDATRVYLPYMLRAVADHGLSHQYASWYRLQPMAVQTYSAAIIAVGSIAAAKWFSWLALAALLLLVSEEVECRSGSRGLGLFAAAAVLSCPLLAQLSASLYVDHVLALLCSAAFIVLFRALRPPCLRGILLSAAIMASAAQVKYTGLIFTVVWSFFLAAVLLRKRGWRVSLRWLPLAGGLYAALALPWYVYVYLGTGNPFYPFLHHWFPSPYWVDNFTLQEVFEVAFNLPPGIGGVAASPWLATYRTSSLVEGYGGDLGFWALALAPCLFLAWLARGKTVAGTDGVSSGADILVCPTFVASRGRQECLPHRAEKWRLRGGNPCYWDMAVVGIAMIAGVGTYTPYVRYWLPAYPLLVASCVLAAGSLLRSISWRLEGRWPPVLAGAALLLLLFLPAPVLCINNPWDAYAKRIGREEYLTKVFPAHPAAQQLNKILAPDDGVLCTGCENVYLVGGRPYDFDFWWNRIQRVGDAKSFAQFCRRYGIRYWMVNSFSMSGRSFASRQDIVGDYWDDARLVAASGMVTVYDVASPARNNLPKVTRHEWPNVIEHPEKSWTLLDPAENWVNLTTAAAATSLAKEAIALTGAAWIGHRLEPEIPGGICRVSLAFWSNELTDPLMEITWYDAKGKLLSRVNGAGCGKSDFAAWLCSSVPASAKWGWLYLREWRQKPIHLKRATVTYWLPSTASAMAAVARHDKPDDETKGVR